jgi:hypothetical protein
VQTGILLIRAALRGSFEQLQGFPWYYWCLTFVVAPLIVLVAQETIKRFDKHSHTRYINILRLQFETRLGMHSPR